MLYTLLSGVFLTLFLVIGTFAFYGYLLRMLRDLPLSWTCYQQVIVLAIVAVLCFIFACLFGTQIPNCYAI
jgi:hypothetical protein